MKIKTKYRILVTKKIFLMITLAVLLTACAISINELLDLFYTIGTIVLSMIILVVVAFKCKLIFLLRDKEWRGIVKSVSVVRDRELITFSIAASNTYYHGMPNMIDYTIIVAETNAETKRLKIPSSKIGAKVFKEGDPIVHYKGMNYPQNPEREDDIHICPLCARSLSQDFCPDCRLDFEPPRHIKANSNWYTRK